MNKNTGFTLIELMVALAIAAILLTVGIPSFKTTIQNNRMASNSNKFLAVLLTARSQAASLGVNVQVCKTSDPNNLAASCELAADWADGALIWADLDGDGVLDLADNELLNVFSGLSGQFTLTSAVFGDDITYLPNGRANNNGSFSLCLSVDNGVTTERSILVSTVGRSHIEEMDCTP